MLAFNLKLRVFVLDFPSLFIPLTEPHFTCLSYRREKGMGEMKMQNKRVSMSMQILSRMEKDDDGNLNLVQFFLFAQNAF